MAPAKSYSAEVIAHAGFTQGPAVGLSHTHRADLLPRNLFPSDECSRVDEVGVPKSADDLEPGSRGFSDLVGPPSSRGAKPCRPRLDFRNLCSILGHAKTARHASKRRLHRQNDAELGFAAVEAGPG